MGILDSLTASAVAAYSIRKLRTAYSGNVVKIRRSSDNNEVDVAFDTNDTISGTSAVSPTTWGSTLSAFADLTGTPINCFNKAWWRILKIAGIIDFHFHDLRHTFCSNLLMAGGDLKDAKEMIGHSSISMTDRYSHLSALHKQNRQKLLAQYYDNFENQKN